MLIHWDPFGNVPLLGSELAMNVIKVPKASDYSAAMETDAPSWWGSPSQVFVTCGGCGDHLNITTWSIAKDGTVSPSIFHNEARCGWHVFVQLTDWSA
jgi:hypothetical protein